MATDDVDDFLANIGSRRAQDAAGASLDDTSYLRAFGLRLMNARTRAGMSRRLLARESGVSHRYVTLAERGEGNVSILILRSLARTLAMPLHHLLETPAAAPFDHITATLSPAQIAAAQTLLTRHFAPGANPARAHRIALIGLPGAGKTVLGRMLAEARGVPFIEFADHVATATGQAMPEVFQRFSQPAVQRLERRVLEQLLASTGPAVLAIGETVPTSPAAFTMLLRGCRTIWFRATPAELVRRAATHPAGRRSAADLLTVLATHEDSFQRADAVLDTTGRSLAESLAGLIALAT